MALRKGDALIEFFSNLPLMREMYEKKGIVVAKRMYEILIEEKKISMGYKNFAVLFRKHLAPKKEVVSSAGLTPKNEEIAAVISAADHAPVTSIEETREEEETGPIVIRDTQKKHSFNPHAVTIDPKNKW